MKKIIFFLILIFMFIGVSNLYSLTTNIIWERHSSTELKDISNEVPSDGEIKSIRIYDTVLSNATIEEELQ